MPLDGLAVSRQDWLLWGCIFNRVTKIGSHIFGIRRYENSGRWDLNIGRFAINRRYRWDRKNYIRPKMESIMGPRIDHSGVRVLRGQRHKVLIDSITPPPPRTMAKSNIKFVAHNILHTIRRQFTCRSRYYISLLRFLQWKKNITRSLYFSPPFLFRF